MSNINPSSNIFSDFLITADQVCDYLPFVSTITNLVNIVEKAFLSLCCSSEFIKKSRYFTHINDKSLSRCTTLLVPIIGNHIVMSEDDKERQRSMEGKRHRLELVIQENFRTLNESLNKLRPTFEQFKKIINDPNEPSLSLLANYSKDNGIQQPPHQEKIEVSWEIIWWKLKINEKAMSLSSYENLSANQKDMFNQRQKELSQIKKELMEIGQAYYDKYFKTLDDDKLLEEAIKYYLKCNRLPSNIQWAGEYKPTLQTLLPKLKEKISSEKERVDFYFVQIRALINRIGNPS